MTPGEPWKAGGALGGIVFATGGAVMGSMNAGWFGLERDANALFPALGVGALMVAAGWVGSGRARRMSASAPLGRAAAVLWLLGATFFVLNPLLQFAIVGTLAFGVGLAGFAGLLWHEHLMTRTDRALATLAAVGSLTWNTETLSAFLLVGVGLLLAALTIRMPLPRAG